MPKQFYPLFDGQTIFEETVRRNRGLVDRYFVASNAVQMNLAASQLSRCGVERFGSLVEPIGRNTAPAIALVCLALDPDEVVFVTPSDHRISKPNEYERAVRRAIELAKDGHLVTFGVRPSYPETGFGYIEADGEHVVSFREKPHLEAAKQYVAAGSYLWNSGMFVFRAGVFLDELKKYSPEVLAKCQSVEGTQPTLKQMQDIPSISIDYAVLEKSEKVKVVAFEPGWSDLGSFDALYEEIAGPHQGNASLGGVNPEYVRATNNLVVGSTRKICLAGVDDLIIVDTPDALLVVKRGESQLVKDVVDLLRKSESSLLQ